MHYRCVEGKLSLAKVLTHHIEYDAVKGGVGTDPVEGLGPVSEVRNRGNENEEESYFIYWLIQGDICVQKIKTNYGTTSGSG